MAYPSAPHEVEFPVRLSRVLLVIAGMLMLLESLLGVDYAFDVGSSSLRDLATLFCLTVAFPVYLVGLFSLRGATASIWVFFIIQWLNHGRSGIHVGIHLVDPFDWLHGDFTFISAILVSVATWIFCRPKEGHTPDNLSRVFD
jgi:hypothetical protein